MIAQEDCMLENNDLGRDGRDSVLEGLEDGELQQLIRGEGVDVWGQHQNVLENQALLHLQSLTSEDQADQVELDTQNSVDVEDGEIQDDIEPQEANKSKSNSTLDVKKYIECQELLKKNFIQYKTSLVSEKSREAANRICSQQAQKVTKTSKVAEEKLKRRKKENSVSEVSNDEVKVDLKNESGSDYVPSDYDSGSDYEPNQSTKVQNVKRKRKYTNKEAYNNSNERVRDDSLLVNYKARLEKNEINKSTETEPIEKDTKLSGGLIVPGKIWNNLYSYQQDGIKWLWDIHQHQVGGLLGDEMGLGKTVQIIAFLAALAHSKIKQKRYLGLGPTLVVCPATVVHQWLKHFHFWWPPFRVILLHQSSNYAGDRIQLIKEANKNKSIVVTTYESVLKYKSILTELDWNYMILDEGHKIRNPNAKITVAVKRFRTPHRLILTGSPMQNNLQELWSLFDFIVPGKLGTQQVFLDHFAAPITQGGYVNATPTQETTALLIATSLKDMISPYMLRRTKDEVKDCIYLPTKSEQVLFCSLTEEQKDLYRGYLLSDHVGGIIGRVNAKCSENQTRANILVGITNLRKICNHPDLYLGAVDEPGGDRADGPVPPEQRFGYYKRSGKMVVVAALLKIWKRQGQRVLLFTQSRAMVDIFEDFLEQQDYKYLKMDGGTSVASRQLIIDRFNQDAQYDVFLLTTRVGGLGVNLTGANRVVIYDPDWNPATDTQARERAWRIGQLRHVTVYRLVSAGTIEEKMYQRQVWKQLLSNKVLLDPRTQRFFKSSDLTELFSLQEESSANPETADIFRNSKVEVKKRKKTQKKLENVPDIEFSEDKIQAMKNLAQEISKKISSAGKKPVQAAEEPAVARPSPAELRALNRKKTEVRVESGGNKIDDQQTDNSFSNALLIAEKNSLEFHGAANKDPAEAPRAPQEGEGGRTEAEVPRKKTKRDKRSSVKVDDTGQIDGESVEGLVKREVKRHDKTVAPACHQDQYVLEKLFSGKGVHTALQHDVIVQSGRGGPHNLRVHHEAKQRADRALSAIRKSRLNNWRW